LLTVGINAAPLLAPRTGVGRYIAGLLSGLERLSRPPGGPWRFQPLFATQAALAAAASGADSPRGGWAPLDVARRLGKLLPGGYALAEAARGLGLQALRREGRLSVYHETNHAAPPFDGPLVLTVHDLSTVRFPETQDPARARYFGKALREKGRLAHRVVVPSAAVGREVVAELHVEPARVVVAHHGVDARFTPAPGPAQVPPALAARGVRGPYLLFVGALDARKGLPELVDAYRSLPAPLQREHPLVLAGPDGTASDWLRARAPAGLVRPGFVADEELPALYRGAAAVCLPSRYEGFGLPLAEALACGAVCVASDDPALVEVAAGCALHAPRGDAPALAGLLQQALTSAELRRDLQRKGPARAAALTWEATALVHVQAYLGALGVEAAR
jgi:alpha-1,3-rhamnosyl/mannosyltransferase